MKGNSYHADFIPIYFFKRSQNQLNSVEEPL